MGWIYLVIVCFFSVLDISCLAEEFCDNNVCVNEEYIFSKVVSFAVFVTLVTLIICCPCILYKHCCTRRDPGVVYTTSSGVAVNMNSTYPPFPQQQYQHQQPIVYPIYGIPPPEYTPTAPPVNLPPQTHQASLPTH